LGQALVGSMVLPASQAACLAVEPLADCSVEVAMPRPQAMPQPVEISTSSRLSAGSLVELAQARSHRACLAQLCKTA